MASGYVGIDSSTKTGIVRLDEDGEIWESVEIHKQGADPDRMIALLDEIDRLIAPGDIICIEDFAYSKGPKMALLGGIGWGIRMMLRRRRIRYHEVSTGQLKNFAGCKGNAGKDDLILPIYQQWGFKSGSDNVRDAFILAQICLALHRPVKLFKYQEAVIQKVRGRV